MTTARPHTVERQATRCPAVGLFAAALLLAAGAATVHLAAIHYMGDVPPWVATPAQVVFSGVPLLAVVMLLWFLIKKISTSFFLRVSRRRLYVVNALGILALVASLLYWLMVYPAAAFLGPWWDM